MAKKKDGKKARKVEGKEKGEASEATKKGRKGARAKALEEGGGQPAGDPAETLVSPEDLMRFLVHIQRWVQIVHDALANPAGDGRFRARIPEPPPSIVIGSSPDRPC